MNNQKINFKTEKELKKTILREKEKVRVNGVRLHNFTK